MCSTFSPFNVLVLLRIWWFHKISCKCQRTPAKKFRSFRVTGCAIWVFDTTDTDTKPLEKILFSTFLFLPCFFSVSVSNISSDRRHCDVNQVSVTKCENMRNQGNWRKLEYEYEIDVNYHFFFISKIWTLVIFVLVIKIISILIQCHLLPPIWLPGGAHKNMILCNQNTLCLLMQWEA